MGGANAQTDLRIGFCGFFGVQGRNFLEQGLGYYRALSEDIDLALDRKFLEFTGELGKNQVDKLRRASHQFIREQFFPSLLKKFHGEGLEGVVFH